MLVGPSFGGKSTVKNILMKAYNRLNQEYSELEDEKEKEKGMEKW